MATIIISRLIGLLLAVGVTLAEGVKLVPLIEVIGVTSVVGVLILVGIVPIDSVLMDVVTLMTVKRCQRYLHKCGHKKIMLL